MKQLKLKLSAIVYKLRLFKRTNSLEQATYSLINRVNTLQSDIRNMNDMLTKLSGNKLRSYQQAVKRIKRIKSNDN